MPNLGKTHCIKVIWVVGHYWFLGKRSQERGGVFEPTKGGGNPVEVCGTKNTTHPPQKVVYSNFGYGRTHWDGGFYGGKHNCKGGVGGLPASTGPYGWDKGNGGRSKRTCYCQLPTRDEKDLWMGRKGGTTLTPTKNTAENNP